MHTGPGASPEPVQAASQTEIGVPIGSSAVTEQIPLRPAQAERVRAGPGQARGRSWGQHWVDFGTSLSDLFASVRTSSYIKAEIYLKVMWGYGGQNIDCVSDLGGKL